MIEEQFKQKRKQFLTAPRPPYYQKMQSYQDINLNSQIKANRVQKNESLMQIQSKQNSKFNHFQASYLMNQKQFSLTKKKSKSCNASKKRLNFIPKRNIEEQASKQQLNQTFKNVIDDLKKLLREFEKIIAEFETQLNSKYSPAIKMFQNSFQQINKKLNKVQTGYQQLKPVILTDESIMKLNTKAGNNSFQTNKKQNLYQNQISIIPMNEKNDFAKIPKMERDYSNNSQSIQKSETEKDLAQLIRQSQRLQENKQAQQLKNKIQ